MSEDRIRLRRNPPNVSTPQGYEDLYVDSSGTFIRETAGGVKEEVGTGAPTTAAKITDAGATGIDILQSATPAAARSAISDENGNFPTQGVAFADTAGVALADGVVGWNNTLDTWVMHDGTTIGGVAIVSADPNIRRDDIIATDYTVAKELEVASFPLTALQAVVGSRFRITGWMNVIVTGSNKPSNLYIGFTTRSNIDDDLGGMGGFPARVGFIVGFDYPTAGMDTAMIHFNTELVLMDSSPNFALDFYAANQRELLFNGATVTGALKTSADTVGIGTDLGLVGTAEEEIVLVIQGTAAGASNAAIYISHDIKFEQKA